MKKIVVLIILSICIAIPCSAQIDLLGVKYIDKEKLKGYSELRIYEYGYKNGKIDKESKKFSHVAIIDETGNIVESKQFRNEALDNYIFFKYNDNGDEISFAFYKDNKPTTDTAIVINHYNNKNNLIKDVTVRPSSIRIMTYTYNNEEKIETEAWSQYDVKGEDLTLWLSVLVVYSYEYNNKGQVVKRTRAATSKSGSAHNYNTRDAIITDNNYTYNSQGLIEEEVECDYHENPTKKFIYEYK